MSWKCSQTSLEILSRVKTNASPAVTYGLGLLKRRRFVPHRVFPRTLSISALSHYSEPPVCTGFYKVLVGYFFQGERGRTSRPERAFARLSTYFRSIWRFPRLILESESTRNLGNPMFHAPVSAGNAPSRCGDASFVERAFGCACYFLVQTTHVSTRRIDKAL